MLRRLGLGGGKPESWHSIFKEAFGWRHCPYTWTALRVGASLNLVFKVMVSLP